jgi:two-component system sensor histidine kinase KdpD
VLFEQVIGNLIDNADKYSASGRPIDVRATIEGALLRLEIADRGPGLRPGEELRVFEKFYRGAGSAGRPGSGLGLAICQGIVVAHGGTIGVRERVGGGAVFTVLLPLAGEPPVVEQEPVAGVPTVSAPRDGAPVRSAS